MSELNFDDRDPAAARQRRAAAAAHSRSSFHPLELATYVFILSLAVFFTSSLIAFLVIRLTGNRLAASVPIQLPWSIWISTAALLLTSFSLSRSLAMVRRERQLPMRRWLVASSVLGLVFLVVQGFSLSEILNQHFVALESRMSLYGIVFFLIALHALHVLGGMLCLAVVTLRGFQYRYDHECYRGLKVCAIYWHFLDIVWVFMLAALYFAG